MGFRCPGYLKWREGGWSRGRRQSCPRFQSPDVKHTHPQSHTHTQAQLCNTVTQSHTPSHSLRVQRHTHRRTLSQRHAHNDTDTESTDTHALAHIPRLNLACPPTSAGLCAWLTLSGEGGAWATRWGPPRATRSSPGLFQPASSISPFPSPAHSLGSRAVQPKRQSMALDPMTKPGWRRAGPLLRGP